MSLVLENSSDLIDLGDAIRSKTGGSSNLTVAQMATAVDALTISQNWTKIQFTGYTANTDSYNNGKRSRVQVSQLTNPFEGDWMMVVYLAPSTTSSSWNATWMGSIIDKLYLGQNSSNTLSNGEHAYYVPSGITANSYTTSSNVVKPYNSSFLTKVPGHSGITVNISGQTITFWQAGSKAPIWDIAYYGQFKK